MRPLPKHKSSRALTMSPLAVAIATFATSTLVASAAFACGGFFCSTQPVEQTGEEILFAVIDDGTIEAHVRVEYEGPSEQFAWIVPTPSLPEVGLSSERLFEQMAGTFGAQFRVDWQFIGDCSPAPRAESDVSMTFSDSGINTEGDTGTGVNVVLQDAVGPYDYVILQASDTTELFEWLNANEYLIPDNVAPFVDPYVMMGNDVHFVAFRLTKTADAGDIQPVLLRYTADEPMVPIQLTAVATSLDLGVNVNVLGYDRAVPDNYLHVHINEARIDWLNGAGNYDALVTAAMNEAGGQGFTTEYAGPSSPMQGILYAEGRFDTEGLAGMSSREDFVSALARQGLTNDNQLLGLLQQYMPMPDGVVEQGISAQTYYNCVQCYGNDEPFDTAGLASAIEERIVEPLAHAQSLFDDLPYLSRLSTTLSADEMTLDPSFTFNADMGDVDNVRRATAVVDCSRGGDRNTNPITVTLSDGRSWVVPASQRFSGTMFSDAPAAARFEETASVGAPQLIVDNSEVINAQLAATVANTPLYSGNQNRSGCSVAPSAKHTSLAALAGLAFCVRRRRRR